jgi:hypothetical protein
MKKVNIAWLIILTLVVTGLNLGYNFFHPSMDDTIKYAQLEWYSFTQRYSIDRAKCKGPIIDLSDNEFYIFKWDKIESNDTLIYEVKVYRYRNEDAVITW